MLQLRKTISFVLKHPLGSRYRWASFLRLLRWQLGTRLLPYPVAVPFIEDVALVLEKGMTGATGNYYVGLHEFHEMMFALHFLRATDRFFDIGANVGSWTVLAAGVARTESHCFEPVPATFRCLCRNVRYNDLDRLVSLNCMALGGKPGEIQFSVDLGPMNQAVDTDYSGNSIRIPVGTLDDYRSTLKGTVLVELWKIDVEGFEENVLRGALNSLMAKEVKVVFLEANSVALQRQMITAGFERYSYNGFSRSLNPVTPSKRAANNLWVRDPQFVQERCLQSAQKKVLGFEY